MGLGPPPTSQQVPKRSVTMPKASAQKVGAIGMPTVPPAASLSKHFFASST